MNELLYCRRGIIRYINCMHKYQSARVTGKFNKRNSQPDIKVIPRDNKMHTCIEEVSIGGFAGYGNKCPHMELIPFPPSACLSAASRASSVELVVVVGVAPLYSGITTKFQLN